MTYQPLDIILCRILFIHIWDAYDKFPDFFRIGIWNYRRHLKFQYVVFSGCNALVVPFQQLLEGPMEVLLCEHVNDLCHSLFHLLSLLGFVHNWPTSRWSATNKENRFSLSRNGIMTILCDDWPTSMISSSNEQQQQQLEYTLLKPDCHSWWFSKMQSGREDTLEEWYAIKFCFELGKNATETYGILQTAFRPSCMNQASVFEWHKRFKEGREFEGWWVV